MIVTELAALIKLQGVKNAVSQLKDFSQHIQTAAKSLYDVTAKAREFAVSLDMYHINTGMSTEQLQQLSFTAAQAGVSIDELGSTIQHLQNLSAKANLGEGWSPVLSRFGIMPGQDPVTQLNRISAGLKRLRAAGAEGEARQLASEVGLNDKMYYALMKGFTGEMNKQFILTRKEQNALVKLNAEWNKAWFYVKQIAVKIQALGAGLQTKFVEVLVNAVQGFGELAMRVGQVLNQHQELQYLIAGVVLYLNPWLAALTAIALIFEDIFVYFQGGSSVTGRLVEWCKQSERFKDIWLGIKTVFDLIKFSLKGLQELWQTVILPILNKISETKWLMNIIKVVERALNPLEQIGYARRKMEELTSSENARPNMSTISTGNVSVQTTVNMNGTANPREDGQTIADTVSTEVESAARQNSYAPIANQGMKYEPAT